jgi:predicted RNA-binding Zn-ribbon protein involved in translation (DUF1610 family)
MASARKKNTDAPGTREMFRKPQGHLFDKSLEEHRKARAAAPVECLGMTFPNDDARREFFLEKLEEKLKDPDFRKIEGFPIGEDDDILRLSDPPYYTACPNPFLQDFARHYGRPFHPSEPYHRTPFAVDVSEGKTDALYKAHSYHTKVPPKAIIRAILHYTEPGDLVLDGFAGSGMTGVAAQLCGSPDPEFKKNVDAEWKAAGLPAPSWGARRAILSELSPAATFIAANYNLPFDVEEFARQAQRILDEVEAELGWMYETAHKGGKKGRINYTVWSEVFSCPECAKEIVFLEEALDKKTKRVREEFPCPHCGVEVTKRRLERTYESRMDGVLKRIVRTPKRKPVLINYNVGGARYEKDPDATDLALLLKIESLAIPPEVPTPLCQCG